VAYIVGHKEWLDLDLIVDERVLIPRPETETLFDLAARWLESESLAPEVLERFWIVDVCTGSGCLALALSRRFPEIPVTGVDISKDALEVSMINASRLETTVEWLEGDVMDTGFWDDCRSALRARAPRGVLLVGNPPYVSEAEYLACEQGVREFEPRLALVAAEDGLAVVRGLTQMWLTLAAENPHTEFFLALEAAAGHPRSVIGSSSEHPLVSHAPAQISAREEASAFPRQGLFIGEDLDGKDRFLLGRSSAVPRSLH
jgi:release factor glutamine methyltransferase